MKEPGTRKYIPENAGKYKVHILLVPWARHVPCKYQVQICEVPNKYPVSIKNIPYKYKV